MRKILGLILLSVLIMASCGKKEAATEKAPEMSGSLSFLLGKVEISADGKTWSDAKLNDPVKTSYWIATGAQSQAKVQIWNSSSFLVQSNTRVRIDTLAAGQRFDMTVEKGSVRCQVEKVTAQAGFYKVKGVAMAAGVRGTEFDLYSDGDKDILKVKEGRVAVKRNVENAPEKLVGPGEGVVISLKENEALKKKLQGKTKEEAEKILDIPVKNEVDLEKELPEDMRAQLKAQEKMVEESSKKQDAFVEKKSQEVEETAKTQEKKIDQMTEKKGQEIDKMMKGEEGMDMDSLLKKAKDRKKK